MFTYNRFWIVPRTPDALARAVDRNLGRVASLDASRGWHRRWPSPSAMHFCRDFAAELRAGPGRPGR